MKEIEAHPANSSYTVGVNQFTDLTWEEFKQGYLTEEVENKTFLGEAPSSKDLDWKRYTTEIKNQGMCGSCWAFSTTGSMEAHLNKQKEQTGDDKYDLSE
jgi:cathepsin H